MAYIFSVFSICELNNSTIKNPVKGLLCITPSVVKRNWGYEWKNKLNSVRVHQHM